MIHPTGAQCRALRWSSAAISHDVHTNPLSAAYQIAPYRPMEPKRGVRDTLGVATLPPCCLANQNAAAAVSDR